MISQRFSLPSQRSPPFGSQHRYLHQGPTSGLGSSVSLVGRKTKHFSCGTWVQVGPYSFGICLPSHRYWTPWTVLQDGKTSTQKSCSQVKLGWHLLKWHRTQNQSLTRKGIVLYMSDSSVNGNLLHALWTLYPEYFSPIPHGTGLLSVLCGYWAFWVTALRICIAPIKQCDWKPLLVCVRALDSLEAFHPLRVHNSSVLRAKGHWHGKERHSTGPRVKPKGFTYQLKVSLFSRRY